jgi:hypothetical protein
MKIWKFYEIFERVVSLLRHAMGCLPWFVVRYNKTVIAFNGIVIPQGVVSLGLKPSGKQPPSG